MASQKLCHPEGELAMVRAATAAGLPYTLSTMATSSIHVIGLTGWAGRVVGWCCFLIQWFVLPAARAPERREVAGWLAGDFLHFCHGWCRQVVAFSQALLLN